MLTLAATAGCMSNAVSSSSAACMVDSSLGQGPCVPPSAGVGCLERSASVDGSEDGNDRSLQSDSSLSDQVTIAFADQSSSCGVFRRGHVPFRRAGSFLSSRSSRASNTSSGAFSVNSDVIARLSLADDDGVVMVADSDNEDGITDSMNALFDVIFIRDDDDEHL